MAQPVWITPAGDLGTVAEGIFFQVPLVAVDPDAGTVFYELVAGSLPAGVQITGTGSVVGVPSARAQGVPSEIGSEITSKFAIRAYVNTVGGRVIADRTFSLTVAGQDLPDFVTPAGHIGTVYEGSPTEIQIEFTDQDPSDSVVASVISGSLPPGLSMNTRGLITGYILPLSANKTYTFTVRITDGKEQNLRTFNIFAVNRDELTADTTLIDADTTYITADEGPVISPFMTNYPTNGYIGLFRNSNYFAYQFQGIILNGSNVAYELATGDSLGLPENLKFDGATGWLYGNIIDYGITDKTFNFTVYVYDVNDPENISIPYDYSLEIIGPIENSVIWLNQSVTTTTDGSIDLGPIDNGSISLFTILAANSSGKKLQFKLKPNPGASETPPDYTPGVYNRLPQGLSLLPSGNIAGRVSFDTFTLDGGTTTLDEQRDTRLIPDPTTIDMVYHFTVEAYSVDGLISVFQDFTIRVVRAFNEPYNSIYIQAMPPQNDRNLLADLLQNQDIMRPSLIFRQDDPYFGVARNVIYTHVYAIKDTEIENYVAAMDLNHFRKQLTLGEIKVAQALDANDNVVYEVVYSEIVDTGVNSDGQSPGPTVPVPYPFEYEGQTIKKVYPNSLIEMRDQLVSQVDSFPQILPLWMRSKQTNGRVLNFVKAWVIAYANPGSGKHLAYNIATKFGDQLNLIDFIADRYELDRQYSKNWNPADNQWTPGQNNWFPITTTTFDINNVYAVDVTNGGSGYRGEGPTYSPDNFSTNPDDSNYQGDTLLISGASVNGVDPDNDAVVRVTSVTNIDTITLLNESGLGFEVGQLVVSAPTLTEWDPSQTYVAGTVVSVGGWPYYVAVQNVPLVDPADPPNPVKINNPLYWQPYAFNSAFGEVISAIGNTIQVLRYGNDSAPFSNIIKLATRITVYANNTLEFLAGKTYTIAGPLNPDSLNYDYTEGATTNFVAVGASVNEAGVTFVAFGPAAGNGYTLAQTTAECGTVSTVSGIINGATISGESSIFAHGNSYSNVEATSIISSGSGAIFTVSAPNPTTFDNNSLQFNTPADKYGLTDEYNKYLLFPKTNILG